MTYQPPSTAERIRNVLRKRPTDWHGATDIARALGVPRADVRTSLLRLAALGAAERDFAALNFPSANAGGPRDARSAR